MKKNKIGLLGLVLLASCSYHKDILPSVTSESFRHRANTFANCSTIGDSISAGALLPDPKTQAYPYLVGNMVGCTMQNLAISGTHSCDMLTEEVPHLNPLADLVILNAGTNDVWKNTADGTPLTAGATCYRHMVTQIQSIAPNAKIVFINVREWWKMDPPEPTGFADTVSTWNDLVYREYQATPNSLYIDIRTPNIMYLPQDWYNPPVHPNPCGDIRIANHILRALSAPTYSVPGTC